LITVTVYESGMYAAVRISLPHYQRRGSRVSTTREVAEQIVEAAFGTLKRPSLLELVDAIDQALQAERERAAKVAEIMAAGETYETGRQKAMNIAAAIRERKPQE
jgi:uncharacterized protein YpiB (UPF0302 family)